MQLCRDLLGFMLLLEHSDIPSGSIAYFTEGHFSGGKPITPDDRYLRDQNNASTHLV